MKAFVFQFFNLLFLGFLLNSCYVYISNTIIFYEGIEIPFSAYERYEILFRLLASIFCINIKKFENLKSIQHFKDTRRVRRMKD